MTSFLKKKERKKNHLMRASREDMWVKVASCNGADYLWCPRYRGRSLGSEHQKEERVFSLLLLMCLNDTRLVHKPI